MAASSIYQKEQQAFWGPGLITDLVSKCLAAFAGYLALKLVVFVFQRRHLHKTFHRMKVACPKPHFIHGHLYETRRQPYVKFAQQMHEQFGPTVGMYLGGDPFLLTKDLELIQQVFVAKSRIFYDRMPFYLNVDPVPDNLICQRGERWRYMRRLLTPAFNSTKIRSPQFYRDALETAIKFMLQLENNSTSIKAIDDSRIPENESVGSQRVTLVVDVYDRMAAVALDVIIKTAFHMDNMISFTGPVSYTLTKKAFQPAKAVDDLMAILWDKLRDVLEPLRSLMIKFYKIRGSKTSSQNLEHKQNIDSPQEDTFLETVKRASRLGFNPLVELIFCFPFLDKPLTFLCNRLYFSSIIKLLFGRLDYLVRRARPATISISSPKGDPGVEEKQQQLQSKKRIIDSLIEVLKERKITKSEFTGNAFVIVFAGFETTANALTFTLWLIARHSHVQTKLRQEVRKLIRKHATDTNEPTNSTEASDLTNEQLHALATSCQYLENVINESLRLYPPVPGLSCRQASVDCELANGLKIERGVNVIPSVFSIHRDKTIWGQSANEFCPERFEMLDVNQLNSAMFMPFGLGPRNCIGKAAAMHELKIVIGRILLDYSIECAPGRTPECLKLCSPINITITNSEPIALNFIKIPQDI